MKAYTAIHYIDRGRSAQPVKPGELFQFSGEERDRLLENGSIREATDDEIAMAKGRVQGSLKNAGPVDVSDIDDDDQVISEAEAAAAARIAEAEKIAAARIAEAEKLAEEIKARAEAEAAEKLAAANNAVSAETADAKVADEPKASKTKVPKTKVAAEPEDDALDV